MVISSNFLRKITRGTLYFEAVRELGCFLKGTPESGRETRAQVLMTRKPCNNVEYSGL